MERQLNLSEYAKIELPTADLVGKKISVLLNGLYGKESYTGICQFLGKSWLQLRILGYDKYDVLWIQVQKINSILRYNRQEVY